MRSPRGGALPPCHLRLACNCNTNTPATQRFLETCWDPQHGPYLEGPSKAARRCRSTVHKPVWNVQQATTLRAGSGPQHNAGLRHEYEQNREKHNQHVLNNQHVGSAPVLLPCYWRSLSFFTSRVASRPSLCHVRQDMPPECATESPTCIWLANARPAAWVRWHPPRSSTTRPHGQHASLQVQVHTHLREFVERVTSLTTTTTPQAHIIATLPGYPTIHGRVASPLPP
ncbi:hypothetical protein GMOD_00003656 [Pyrenophora seminiperda CCB06]|uniref:Uncharacterized protein n=1 Tax=Pyrenophora seminiperda CCB06 TaxID=1302712 RepID=A0A3M7MJJ0_9PLEO|nr:hypothetical protein GMOD_00003656 [Pyrenophora seminiperda CCB06]